MIIVDPRDPADARPRKSTLSQSIAVKTQRIRISEDKLT